MEIDRYATQKALCELTRKERDIRERECPRSSKSFKTTTTFFTRLLCRRFSREKEEEHPRENYAKTSL